MFKIVKNVKIIKFLRIEKNRKKITIKNLIILNFP